MDSIRFRLPPAPFYCFLRLYTLDVLGLALALFTTRTQLDRAIIDVEFDRSRYAYALRLSGLLVYAYVFGGRRLFRPRHRLYLHHFIKTGHVASDSLFWERVRARSLSYSGVVGVHIPGCTLTMTGHHFWSEDHRCKCGAWLVVK